MRPVSAPEDLEGWGKPLVAISNGCEVSLALIGLGKNRANGRRSCCKVLYLEKVSGARPAGA